MEEALVALSILELQLKVMLIQYQPQRVQSIPTKFKLS